MTNALITGISGQDGAHLTRLLLNKGYKVFGIDIQPSLWRLKEIGLDSEIEIVSADITDLSSLVRALQHSKADELYHLASQSFVGSSFDHPIAAGLVTGIGTLNVLEAVKLARPACRVYNAATSELYGDNASVPQNESTPMQPSSPYAAAKLYAYQITRLYREAYDIFACNGILFNHEGEFRGEEFVTRKISLGVARIYHKLVSKLYLGNPNARRDWGYADEYVEAMYLALHHNAPEDFVIATGSCYSVRDFCCTAFECVDLDYADYVVFNEPKFIRPQDVSMLCGDATKSQKMLGWTPTTKFPELVKLMVNADVERVSREKGECCGDKNKTK